MRIDKQVDHYVNCCWVNDLYRFTTIVYPFVLSHTHISIFRGVLKPAYDCGGPLVLHAHSSYSDMISVDIK